ncbi:histone deacetylase family protein [Marinimicrobium sp. C6131]|uniref:histone deacetylase family protein n=1 Tax=Marinimicrobium sp. C6131 TaxID=3022676 RepID=UPI00223CB02C|nr:histone deacetylase family protein [Marinimicrobium sp. C6131]UZJ43444.1 histone deacetylase family protein [Marinimicrobium sp. C6131]
MKAFFHPSQDKHAPQSYLTRGQMRPPQELPERTPELVKGLEALGVRPEQATDHGMDVINRVHDLGYLRFLESAHRRWPEDWGGEVMSNIFVRSPNPMRGILAECARYQADGSCPIGPHTWEAAYWSAQSALSAADELLTGQQRAYALCRPPGHHARHDAAGGFCYLNNAAIAAEALLDHYDKVAILDPDMHHGQGIQEIFYDRDDVLYISIHGDPTNFYPVVSGYEDERGAGPGYGYNINMPMPHGSPESTFFERMADAADAIRLYEPDVLIVALGFDVYHEDPQAKVSVSSEGFRHMGEGINAMNLPTLVIQEGGYHLESLATNANNFFSGLNP